MAVIKIALIIMAILLLVAVSKEYFGVKSLPFTAFITGLFEVHGMSYAIALIYNDQSLTMPEATELLAIVLVAGFISKFILVGIIAHNRFALVISSYLTIMLAAGAGVYFLFPPY
jgi:uncharacterized membrane protein (DUF4010 family)